MITWNTILQRSRHREPREADIRAERSDAASVQFTIIIFHFLLLPGLDFRVAESLEEEEEEVLLS